MLEIKEVVSKKEKKIFAKYPIELYKGCPYYVPSIRSDEINTFNPKKNFNLANNQIKAFLCYKDGKVVGRIAGMINRKDNELTGKKMIRFSRFDCIDDKEVFKALLDAVEKFGKEYGMNIIHGPWGFNDTDREGLLTFGFDKRSTYATTYSYPYFAKNMVELGYADESKWMEYDFKIPTKVDERVDRIAGLLKKRYNLVDVLETMTVSQVADKYGDAFFETYNKAYGHLDGFVPIEGKAKKNILKQFAIIVNRRYASVLVDKEGRVAALGIVLPSIADALIKSKGKLFPFGFISVLKSKHKPKELEMALIAVHEKYKNSGITTIFIKRIMKNIIDDKIVAMESNPMLETNTAILQEWKFVDVDIVKRRQTYQKQING